MEVHSRVIAKGILRNMIKGNPRLISTGLMESDQCRLKQKVEHHSEGLLEKGGGEERRGEERRHRLPTCLTIVRGIIVHSESLQMNQ